MLGALCGQVGSVMAAEAVKLVVGIGEPLLGRVLVLDGLASRWSEVPLVGDPARAASGAAADPAPPVTGPAPDDAADSHAVPTLTARELADRLTARDGGTDDFLLVDVREPGERAVVAVPGAVSAPLATVLEGRADLPRDVPLVLHCRSGARSEQAARALRAAGYDDVRHLAGGVLAWVADVDPTLPTY